jgi:hypothetical protein
MLVPQRFEVVLLPPVHCPLVHSALSAHTFPQPPQWAMFVLVSTHSARHWVSPPGQTHAPSVHEASVAHWLPQPPQLAGLLLVSTHEFENLSTARPQKTSRFTITAT